MPIHTASRPFIIKARKSSGTPFFSSTVCFAKPRPKPIDETQSGEIPANLRRKVSAKRPTLGHIVPMEARRRQKEEDKGGSTPSQLRAQGTRDETLRSPGNLKILSGTCKGRKLQSPSVYLR